MTSAVDNNIMLMLFVCMALVLVISLLDNKRLENKLKMFSGPLYTFIAHGDGARCWIVPESRIYSELHDCYCSESHKWDACQMESFRGILKDIDDEDNWTKHYPDYKRFSWVDHGEDYTLEIVRLS